MKQSDNDESHGSESARDNVRFRDDESHPMLGFAQRLRDAIGDEPVSAFARRCRLPESNIRSYIDGLKTPRLDKVMKIAHAARVSVDWLATGQGIREASQLRAAERALRGDLTASAALSGPLARRLDKIAQLAAQMSDQDADALMAELYARASQVAELAELKQAVAQLRAASKTA